MTVSIKALMQCYNLTTFRLSLFALVSKPEKKLQKQIANKHRTNLLDFVFN